MMRLIVEDTDRYGKTDERFILEGNYEQLGELYSAMKRMALAMGHFPSNVDKYFSKNEHGDEQEMLDEYCGLEKAKWDKTWVDWAEKKNSPKKQDCKPY